MTGSTASTVTALSCAIAGIGVGFAYFRILAMTLRLWLGRRTVVVPVALTVVRLAAAATAFAVAARLGALPLLALLAGFLAGRWLALRVAEVRP